MTTRLAHVRLLAAALALVAASGCGGPGQPADTPPPAPSKNSGIPLYERFEAQRSVGPNGKPVQATLAGTSFPDSTGMWVGCEGDPATTTYRLDHNFSRLQATAGLQPHTPDGLRVKATITGDDRVLQEFTVGKTTTATVDLDLTGIDTLVVAATAVNPSLCTSSKTPYGALGDAVLTPVDS